MDLNLSTRRSAQCRRNPLFERGEYARFKPRVLLEPDRVPGGRIMAGDSVRQEVLIRFDCLSQALVSGTKMRFNA